MCYKIGAYIFTIHLTIRKQKSQQSIFKSKLLQEGILIEKTEPLTRRSHKIVSSQTSNLQPPTLNPILVFAI